MQPRGPGNTGHTGHRTKTILKMMSNTDSIKNRGWTQVLAKGM